MCDVEVKLRALLSSVSGGSKFCTYFL